jgi:hypothetical protein
MGEMEPVDQPSSAGLWTAVTLLVIALVGAAAYIVHLRGQLTEGKPAPAARAARPATVAGKADVAGPVLSAAQQQAMVATLKAQTTSERKALFHVQQNNADTSAVQAALQQVFEEAGWPTETVRTPYPLKTGIYLLAADDQPSPMVDAVDDAFIAAGIDVQYLTGYRTFFTDRKQQNPNWVGPELAADQPFTIVVGSRPTPKASSAKMSDAP